MARVFSRASQLGLTVMLDGHAREQSNVAESVHHLCSEQDKLNCSKHCIFTQLEDADLNISSNPKGGREGFTVQNDAFE